MVSERKNPLQAAPAVAFAVTEQKVTGRYTEVTNTTRVILPFTTTKNRANGIQPRYQGVTGKPWKVLVSLVQEYDPELAAEIQSYVHPENPGRPKEDGDISSNITNSSPPARGTTTAYTLNRLRRDHGELFEKVKAGELTANAAAIEAGFRKKPTPFGTPLPKLSDAEWQTIKAIRASETIQLTPTVEVNQSAMR